MINFNKFNLFDQKRRIHSQEYDFEKEKPFTGMRLIFLGNKKKKKIL
jgi:hypothetical protein